MVLAGGDSLNVMELLKKIHLDESWMLSGLCKGDLGTQATTVVRDITQWRGKKHNYSIFLPAPFSPNPPSFHMVFSLEWEKSNRGRKIAELENQPVFWDPVPAKHWLYGFGLSKSSSQSGDTLSCALSSKGTLLLRWWSWSRSSFTWDQNCEHPS